MVNKKPALITQILLHAGTLDVIGFLKVGAVKEAVFQVSRKYRSNQRADLGQPPVTLMAKFSAKMHPICTFSLELV